MWNDALLHKGSTGLLGLHDVTDITDKQSYGRQETTRLKYNIILIAAVQVDGWKQNSFPHREQGLWEKPLVGSLTARQWTQKDSAESWMLV